MTDAKKENKLIERKKPFNSNHLKIFAIIAMTIDHFMSVIYPHYPTDWWIVALHCIGRITAPTMWFFIAEGFYHTRNWKKYATRLFIFAIVSHFAYNFAFGIPFVPFKTSIFNQTSVIWALAWAVLLLGILKETKLDRIKTFFLTLIVCAITFCADWSCIAVLSILGIYYNRGNFKAQIREILVYVGCYALVYIIFINPLYGAIQMFVCLSFPLVYNYNGQRGKCSWLKWFFYFYYPIHLILVGIVRIYLNGDIGVMIGG